MAKKLNILILTFGLIFLSIIPIYLIYLVPTLLYLPSDLKYEAEIFSIDNFYNPEIEDFSSPVNSETTFSYEVIDEKDNVFLIKNVFRVFEPTGKKIFSVERIYGIDKKTGRHVPGYGDKDRDGYLFAPRGLKKGQPYTYWHINYDAPANMEFKEETNLFGLKVYRYEANYNANQTNELGHLPGVPEEKGVNLDINLQTWIEPVTGKLIRYEDNTVAYYYDIKTGERIHPWNKFNNIYKSSSAVEQVRIAELEKIKLKVYKLIIPLIMGLASSLMFFIFWRQNENKK